MFDERELYVKRLLAKYKRAEFSPHVYTIEWTPYDPRTYKMYDKRWRVFRHNEGIDFVISYIEELEHKVEKLEYVERIIRAAKKEW